MKEELKRIIDLGKDAVKGSPDLFLDFAAVFTKHISTAYNLSCEGCASGFNAAWKLLESTYWNNSKPINNMSNCNFQFKKGITVIFCAWLHKSFSNATLTDEAALCLLKENIDHKMHFEKMPEDWEKQLAEFEMPPSFAEAHAKKVDAAATAIDNALGSDLSNAGKAEVEKAAAEKKDAAAKVMAGLKTMKIDDLKAKANELNLPAEEWTAMVKADLLKYLFEKMTAPAVV